VWGCTCVTARQEHTANGHVLLAHNEDWHSEDRENVYLVRCKPEGRPSFLGMTYGPLLINIGMNAEGIGVAINSVYPNDSRVGVPRILCSRAVLNARTIGEAIRACVPKLRGGGYNYMLTDPYGELYNVETSATEHDILYGEAGWLAHTNHYISPKMRALEEPGTYAGSTVRLNRARRLMQAQLGQITVESLQTLLRDHVNWPDSICAHEDPEDPPHEQGLTLVSLVMDSTERVMWAAPGPPCEGTYTAYQL
jgi:isopenicillin-N N-acyltransferase-like protein